ncbi:MAG TPA: branched-chain amino acid ABC transporter substrate-binding protein [Burkholderiaceae bacterium]
MNGKRRVEGVHGRGARMAAVVAACTLGLLAGCNRTPDVIKIGVAQPLSGELAGQGQDLLNGAKMAVDEINAAGGVDIDGKNVKLEIVSADDKANNEAGDAAAHKLVDAGVEVAIADLNSGVSIHAAPIYAAADIPQLAISTNPKYTKLGLPTTLRLVASDDLQSRALGSYAAQVPGIAHVGVVDDSTPYGKGLADQAAKVLHDMGRTVEVRKSLDNKTTDFSALVAQLQAAKVDLLVTALSDFQVDALITQAAKAGLTDLTIVGGDTVKTDKLLQRSIPIRAVYVTSPIVEAREFEGGKVFLDKFRQIFKSDPVYGAHYTYDAVYLVADALSRDASVDRKQLLHTLKTFDGNCPITNSLRFGPDGEQRYGAVAVYQLRGGAWDPLMRSDRW